MMALSLPEDLEPYVADYDALHASGAYALELLRPVDLRDAWQQHYDTQPEYWCELVNAETVFYVGGTGDLLSRLEDHRDNDRADRDSKRSTVLTQVCDVADLQTAWVGDDYDHATEILEPRLARWLQESRPDSYCHYR